MAVPLAHSGRITSTGHRGVFQMFSKARGGTVLVTMHSCGCLTGVQPWPMCQHIRALARHLDAIDCG